MIMLWAILSVICILLYFLPSIIAVIRHHRNALPIFLLNLFLGWTLIGWIAAIIWSTVK